MVGKVIISKANIRGLNDDMYFFDHHYYWAWGLFFDNPSNMFELNHMPAIALAEKEDVARIVLGRFKKSFKLADIKEGDRVVVMTDRHGQHLAIGKIGKDCWIDLRYDKFRVMNFNQLRIVPTELVIY